MGKRTGKDAKSGKQTYPAVIGEQASVQRAQEMADQAIASLEPFKDAANSFGITCPIRRGPNPLKTEPLFTTCSIIRIRSTTLCLRWLV